MPRFRERMKLREFPPIFPVADRASRVQAERETSRAYPLRIRVCASARLTCFQTPSNIDRSMSFPAGRRIGRKSEQLDVLARIPRVPAPRPLRAIVLSHPKSPCSISCSRVLSRAESAGTALWTSPCRASASTRLRMMHGRLFKRTQIEIRYFLARNDDDDD